MVKCTNSYSKVCGVAYDIADIKRIVEFCKKHKYFFYYIRHTDDDELMGKTYKRHYHFIIESTREHRFNVACLLTDSFKPNLMESCLDISKYLRYMLHIDYDDKPHYSIDRIITNRDKSDLEVLIGNAHYTKADIKRANFNLILTKIVNREFSTWKEIIPFCLENDIDYQTSWTFTFKALFSRE